MAAKATSMPEGRPRPEDDPSEEARDRTQGRASLPAGLERVQVAARHSRHTQFTALLHHVDEAALTRAFRRQRRVASAGVDVGEVAAALQARGLAERELGDMQAARASLEEGLRLAGEEARPALAAMAHTRLGEILDFSHDETEALARYTNDAGNHVAIEVRQAATLQGP